MDNRVVQQENGLAQDLVQRGSGIIDALRNALGVGSTQAAFQHKQDIENAAKGLYGETPVQAPSNTLRNWGINRLPERLKEMGME